MFRRITPLLLGLALVAAACGTGEKSTGASGSSGSSPSTTLTGAFQDTFNPDPDQFFDLQGVMVTNSCYESLVVNPPGSVATKGLLAKSWTISPNGLTYTFKLRPDITFADGTKIDSSAIKASFERRTAAAGSPSYMLGEVKSYETPDPLTFVIDLKTPVNNFLSRLSSPWAPMATNPKIIKEQEAKGDKLASNYLKTHCAGSGPYTISEWVPDQEITLTRNEHYWGTKPFFTKVVFKIISDPTAQRVQLEGGDLDFIQGINPEAADAIAAKGALKVLQPPAFNMTFLQVNSKRPPFNHPDVRAALVKAIPYSSLVNAVFGKWATVAKQTITAHRIPPQYAQWSPPYDPSALKKAFDALPANEKSIPIETDYPAYDNGVHRQINDRIDQILQTAGFKTASKEVTSPEYFGFIGKPDSSPHIMLSTQPDDGVHPDNWYRIWMYSQGALNIGAAGTAQSDALFDRANATPPNRGIPYGLYAQGAKIVTDAGQFIPIADAPVIWVTQPNIAGVTVRDASDQALVIQDLSRR